MRLDHFKTLKTKPDIVMFGDSITAGEEWHELFPNASIVNRGIGQETTSGALQRISEVQQRNPKVVFLLMGINDLGQGETVEAVFNRYKTIATDLVDSDTTVVIQSVMLPGKNVVKERHEQVMDLNGRLRKMAKALSLQYVDLNQSLAPEGFLAPKFTSDGIHLNGAGYTAWADSIESYVNKFDEESGTADL